MSNISKTYVHKNSIINAVKMDLPFKIINEHDEQDGLKGDYLCVNSLGEQFKVSKTDIEDFYIEVNVPNRIDESFREDYIKNLNKFTKEDWEKNMI